VPNPTNGIHRRALKTNAISAFSSLMQPFFERNSK